MSTFGTLFKVTTYGESHCKSVGCIVDGVPPNMSLSEDDIQSQLSRRRPGQSKLTTQRNEKDRVQIQSGTEFGKTLGTPIGMIVLNQDQHPKDYSEMDNYPRPSHADYTYIEKYGIKASSGGGRASARETIGRVAAGAIAEKLLKQVNNVEIVAFVSGVGKCQLDRSSQNPEFMDLLQNITRDQVDAGGPIRCPIPDKASEMTKIVEHYKSQNDSIGGIVTCVVRNVPVGLGEPAFDKLEAILAHAMLSIPATKGFEIGSGFAGTVIPGSEHNDPFIMKGGHLGTKTNNSGGTQGGISNGENIYFSVAFKSPATISKPQDTATYDGEKGVLTAKGRHDPNVVPRAIPIVEAMTALTLADAYLIQKSRASTFGVVH
ncbi:bifunctional chorismate synthase/riboflavin reductase [NAD(P)H] aro2 [Brettanomyces nanus]|uniref:Chorismate synthase n=1 Tax=Eeniella nana TaxID=13502 RepID=A0A875S5T1_EENNA|nr:bifunctional chorismate synthase/riboflavin reductase [NAD(P)H] aro2 [Brettanomyces nanus]QPG76283.1 bifunctional chorismate synthase/riboflavin reductase [NAD(P)H] aro2 [Brettanomyces nanus]